MKFLVADDEPLVSAELAYLLRRVCAGCAVDEVPSGTTALASLARERYDALFLDITMPGLDGIAIASIVNTLDAPPAVVFVTASGGHAIAAFDHDAADYLMKPVDETRLARAIARIRARPRRGEPAVDRLPVERDGRTLLLRIAEIRYVHVSGRDVVVHAYDGAYRFRGSLAECITRLPREFARVHRSYVVHLEHVVEVSTLFAGAYLLRLDDKAKSEIPVSRTFVPAVRASLRL